MSRRKAEWGTTDASIPSTEINEFLITSPPYISKGDLAFDMSTTVEFESIQDEAEIYYSTGMIMKNTQNLSPLMITPL